MNNLEIDILRKELYISIEENGFDSKETKSISSRLNKEINNLYEEKNDY